MNDYILTEFSIFYKRLIVAELALKNLVIQKYSEIYKDNAYNVMYRYFKTIQNKRTLNDKSFIKIHDSDLSEYEKLSQSTYKMYISELLNLFANAVYLKNKKIKNNFFEEYIATNSTDFQQKCKVLKDFRNCIAHGNIKKFLLERKKFINGLVYFEKVLKCNVVISCGLIDKINKSQKLSCRDILSFIYTENKEIFKDDKLLILLFDDIALINGYTFQGLPQRKSIIREHFKILEKVKHKENIYSALAAKNNIQMSLFEKWKNGMKKFKI